MYYIIYGSLYTLSLLPLRVLYLFSDLVYVIMFYITGYRKELVFSNLKNAFPEKSDKEIKAIAKKFYHNLTDTFIELVKAISISKKQVQRRNTGEFDLLNSLMAKGKNIYVLGGHQFNWEFGNLLYAINLDTPYYAVYTTITNKSLNRIFLKMRKKFGSKMISARDFRETKDQIFAKQFSLALAADQNPSNPANAYWLNFLNRPAPFTTGPGKGAVANNAAVVFASMHKLKRGHYSFKTHLLTEEGSKFTPEQITLMYKNELEKLLQQEPSNYLWSHRRWRHEWKPEYGKIVG